MVNHKGLLIKALEFRTPRVVSFEEGFGLKEMYELVESDTLDIVRLPKGIDVWVDDNGLLKSGNVVLNYSLKQPDGTVNEVQLAGNSLFLSSNEKGETIGLTSKQYEWLVNNITVTLYGMTK